jgi:DNA repair protein RadA/Sms
MEKKLFSIVVGVIVVLWQYGSSFKQQWRTSFSAARKSLGMAVSRSGIKAAGSKAPKGRCTVCKEWNTVKPFKAAKLSRTGLDPLRLGGIGSSSSLSSNNSLQFRPWYGNEGSSPGMVSMDSVDLNTVTYRIPLFSKELNRVLGGGLVRGSVTLLAGDPGIGKSTLLLQLASSISSGTNGAEDRSVVYISGEETPEQIASRAQRLGLSSKGVYLICDIDADNAGNCIII